MLRTVATRKSSAAMMVGTVVALSGIAVASFAASDHPADRAASTGVSAHADVVSGHEVTASQDEGPGVGGASRLELKAWVSAECAGDRPSATVRVKNRGFSTQSGVVVVRMNGDVAKKLRLKPAEVRSITWTKVQPGAIVKALSYGVVLDQAKAPASCGLR